MSLPKNLPIMPLDGALLLPRGRLPLNIFEPRYLAMVEDAMASGRMIGIVQPKGDKDGGLYTVGCAGRIVSFSETDDGRFLIVLLGIARFTLEDNNSNIRGYRTVQPNFDTYAQDLAGEEQLKNFNRDKLISSMRLYFKRMSIAANWDAIESLGLEALVIALATSCQFLPSEKQALLEAPDLMARANMLTTLLDIAGQGAAIHH